MSRVVVGKNDIASQYPELLKEWDYEKNRDLKPENISYGSTQKVWWKCALGHEWEAIISNRTRIGAGYPYCSNRKILKGYNDLSATNPELLEEWNYERNYVQPSEVSKNSHKKVWWKCKVCGYQWETVISSRTRGYGCPECGKKKMISKRIENRLLVADSLADANPQIAEEWDFDKNGDITPQMVMPQSNKAYWWKCSKGHSYKTKVSDRQRKNGCPYCSGHKLLQGFNDFATVRSDILSDWDYNKNKDLSPERVGYKSNRKVWWLCPAGHSYAAMISNRYLGNGCPYCSNKKVLNGYNDLASQRPDVVKKWNYKKNKVTPQEVTIGSKQIVWWKCPDCGCEWKAAVYTITGRTTRGCPHCAKEARTSFPEQVVYYYIKKIFPDAISGDRKQIFPKELDIYIPSINVAIEYDGEAFHRSVKKDEVKNRLCKDKGIVLYRIREMECPMLSDNDFCICYVVDRRDDNSLIEAINSICSGLGKTVDIDLERDDSDIQEQYRKKRKENSLGNIYPELLAEWDYEKNKGISPDMFSYGADKKVWWKCSLGHSYSCQISHRTTGNNGCPYCSNKKVLRGFNDILTQYPQVAAEWCYDRNKEKPEDVVGGSHKKVWWKCRTCGNTWEASIANRTKNRGGTGCPQCRSKKIWDTRHKNEIVRKGSVAERYPLLKQEWDYEKNSEKPEEVAASGSTKYWWICSKCGYHWYAQLHNRMVGHGCPSCGKRRKK